LPLAVLAILYSKPPALSRVNRDGPELDLACAYPFPAATPRLELRRPREGSLGSGNDNGPGYSRGPSPRNWPEPLPSAQTTDPRGYVRIQFPKRVKIGFPLTVPGMGRTCQWGVLSVFCVALFNRQVLHFPPNGQRQPLSWSEPERESATPGVGTLLSSRNTNHRSR
jgi:hypothetical protein